MAQFSHADFGGMSRWSPGTSMVGDKFNPQLKSKLDALCTDIAAQSRVGENNRWRALRGGRGQLSVDAGIVRLVAVRFGKAWSGRSAERSSVRSLS
jgi:hypothetical protein